MSKPLFGVPTPIHEPASEAPVSKLRWWHFDQNNSGGYFITNEDVAEDVFIQASSAEEATKRAEALFENYSEYCACCGERWSTYAHEDDGTDSPELYGDSIYSAKAQMFHSECRLHFIDGSVEAYVYGTDPQKTLT